MVWFSLRSLRLIEGRMGEVQYPKPIISAMKEEKKPE